MNEVSIAQNSSPTSDKRIFTSKHQGGWGQNWFFMNFKSSESKITGKIGGHLTPPPRNGDEFYSAMLSGKTGRFVVRSVHYPVDPPDMFFADVEMQDYV